MVLDIPNCPACGHPTRFNNNENPKAPCENCNFPLQEYKYVLEKVNFLSKEPFGQSPTTEDIKSQIKKIIEWRLEYNLIPEFKQFLQNINIKLVINTEINPYNISFLNEKRKEAQPAYEKLVKIIDQFSHNPSNNLEQRYKKSDYIENKNLTNKLEGESLPSLNYQAQQQIQQQIAPLQTQLQDIKKQVDSLQNQLQELPLLQKQLQVVIQLLSSQSTANQVNSPSITSETIQTNQHEPTYQSEYSEELQTQSAEDTTKESSNYNPELPHIPWLKAYNHDPESFEKYQPIPLSITDDSIHQRRLGSSQPIALESNKKGNYWIFYQDNTGTTRAYLVLKANLKVNKYSLETINFLFDFTEENVENYTKITVIYPAVVIQIENDKWQLESRGIIKFEAN